MGGHTGLTQAPDNSGPKESLLDRWRVPPPHRSPPGLLTGSHRHLCSGRPASSRPVAGPESLSCWSRVGAEFLKGPSSVAEGLVLKFLKVLKNSCEIVRG